MNGYIYVLCKYVPQHGDQTDLSFDHTEVYAKDVDQAYLLGARIVSNHPFVKDLRAGFINDYVIDLGPVTGVQEYRVNPHPGDRRGR